MSATRLILRLFLVAVLVLICVLVFNAWRNSKPEYMLTSAQSQLDANKPEAAKIKLQNLVKRFPDNGPGHLMLSKAILEDAKAKKEIATYGRNPEALVHLLEAGKLMPDDIDLQKRVVLVMIEMARPREVGDNARLVLAKEPQNPDALYVMAVLNVSANNPNAKSQLKTLVEMKDYRPFQVLGLAATYYGRQKNEEEIQSMLTRAAEVAAEMPTEKLDKLPITDLASMTQMLMTGIERAPDAKTGMMRGDLVFDTLEKFPATEENKAIYADVAEKSSQVLAILRAKFAPSADSSAVKEVRDDLQQRAEKIRAQALTLGIARPIVFQQAALAAFNSADHEKCAAVLKEGLEAAAKTPPANKADVLELHLLAARNYVVMRKHADAQPHLKALLADEKYAGWGELLSGGIAASEGRHEKAYHHFLTAQKQLGSMVFVNMGMANACLSLGKWNEALPHLAALHKTFDTADVELKAWATQNNISDANVHFGEFRAYLALNDFENAQEHLSALAGTPFAKRGAAMAIMYLWANGKQADALARLREARKLNPDDLTLLQIEAGFLQQAGKGAEAGEKIIEAAAAQPGNLQRQLLLVRWQIQQKKTEEALTLLDKLETQFPKESAPSVLKAQLLMATGETEKAVKVAEKLKENPETAAAANFLLAAADMQQKKPAEAAAELAEAAEKMPNHGLINLLQGEVAASQGDYAGAIDQIGGTLDVTPLKAQARGMLLKSLLLLAAEKGPEEAEKKLAPLLKQNPDDAFLNIAMADFKFKQGQFDVAMKLLDHAERNSAGQADVPYIKASIWLQRGRIDTALSECERAISIKPAHAPSRMMAADLSLRQGKYKEAYEHAAVVLNAAPKYVPMVMTQATALVGMRSQAAALELLQKAIEKQPLVAGYYDALMRIQVDANQKDDALVSIRTGRSKMPDSEALALDEVMLLCELNKYDDAKAVAAAFTKDKTDPKDFARYLAMAQAFFRVRKFDDARDWGGQALAMADDKFKPAIHAFLGDVNLVEYETSAEKKDTVIASARDHFKAVMEAQPTNFIAGNNLAWILTNNFDQTDEAVKVIEQVRGKATVEQMPINFIDTIAVVYRKANRLEEADKVLTRANAMYQENPLLLYQWALVLNDREKYTAARGSLERAIQLGVPEKYQQDAKKMLDSLKSKSDSETQPTSTPATETTEKTETEMP